MSTRRRGQEQAPKVQPPQRLSTPPAPPPPSGGYPSPSTPGQLPNLPIGPAESRRAELNNLQPPVIPQSVTYQQVVDALAILGIDPNIVMSLKMQRRGHPHGSGGHHIVVDLARIPGFPRHVRGEAVIHVDGPPAREPSIHAQWAAVEADGSWTSGADETRPEAEEIVAQRPETTLARRWVGRWEKP